jgi:hypothetical protein
MQAFLVGRCFISNDNQHYERHIKMRYSTTAAVIAALAAASSVTSAPSSSQGNGNQIAFLDPVAEQAAAFLKESKEIIDGLSGSVGNVADKGANWIKEHINDPRCKSTLRLLVGVIGKAGLQAPSIVRSCNDDAAFVRCQPACPTVRRILDSILT